MVTGCGAGKPIESGLASPPDVAAVHLTPANVRVAPLGSVDFTLTLELTDGSQVGAGSPSFQATGGTIDLSGRYTAGPMLGNFLVVGTDGSYADTATVEIANIRTLVGLTVTPTSAAVLPGATQQFTAAGVLSDGADSTVGVAWSTTGGRVSSAGLYTAPSQSGTYLVVARQTSGTLADTARAIVSTLPATMTALVLAPATVALQFGQSQQFSAQALLADGSTTPVGATWSATGGSISGTGLYTAGSTAGSFRAIARAANGMADTSGVTISAPTVTALSLSPSNPSLQTGQTQQFTVQATLSNGGTQNNPSVTWIPEGGTITSSGLFTVGDIPGTYHLIVQSANGVADTATLAISQAVITAITVAPATPTLATTQTLQFGATASLSNGGIQLTPQVRWQAGDGTISSTGFFTPPSVPASVQVTATDTTGLVSGVAQVNVVVPPPPSMFYNSTEPGCSGSDPTVVWCDDFEDGDWYTKNCDVARSTGGLLQTDGWCGTIYADSYIASAIQCGGQGAAATNCAAFSGQLPGPNPDNTGNMGDHDLGPNFNNYGELYFRWYIKYSTDHTLNPQKTLTLNSTHAGSGGISIAGFGNGAGWASMCPLTDCGGNINNLQNTGCPGDANYYLCQNQGNNLSFSSVLGHWVYMEMHVKMNTAGQANGVYELWLNDCGTNGVCLGAPTLRARFTNVRWSTDGRLIQSFWVENQSPPPPDGPSRGSEWYDQIKVSQVGPIGFAP